MSTDDGDDDDEWGNIRVPPLRMSDDDHYDSSFPFVLLPDDGSRIRMALLVVMNENLKVRFVSA